MPIKQLFGCKYISNYSVSQNIFTFIFLQGEEKVWDVPATVLPQVIQVYDR